MPTNDVVRQFAVDIERNRATIIQLQKSCRRNTIMNVILSIGLAITGAELYLLEKDKNVKEKVK